MRAYYIGDIATRDSKLPMHHLEQSSDTRFCTFLTMILLLLLTLLSLFLRRSLNESYHAQLYVEDQFYTYFNPKLNMKYSPADGVTLNPQEYQIFDYINNMTEFTAFLN